MVHYKCLIFSLFTHDLVILLELCKFANKRDVLSAIFYQYAISLIIYSIIWRKNLFLHRYTQFFMTCNHHAMLYSGTFLPEQEASVKLSFLQRLWEIMPWQHGLSTWDSYESNMQTITHKLGLCTTGTINGTWHIRNNQRDFAQQEQSTWLCTSGTVNGTLHIRNNQRDFAHQEQSTAPQDEYIFRTFISHVSASNQTLAFSYFVALLWPPCIGSTQIKTF